MFTQKNLNSIVFISSSGNINLPSNCKISTTQKCLKSISDICAYVQFLRLCTYTGNRLNHETAYIAKTEK